MSRDDRNMNQNGERHRNPSELLLDSEMIRERKTLAELENEWVNLIRAIRLASLDGGHLRSHAFTLCALARRVTRVE